MTYLFDNNTNKIEGLIASMNLENWFCNSFTQDEQRHMVEVYQLEGMPKDPLIVGNFKNSSERPLRFLSTLTAWFNNPRDSHIARKTISKAEEYISLENNIFDLHFFYPTKMKLFYKDRENPESLAKAIEAAQKQIAIADRAAVAFRKEYNDPHIPTHEGYNQLCIIYEKQKNFVGAINLARQAKEQGWSGNWDWRIERCTKKMKA
jgi:hypothetical protein